MQWLKRGLCGIDLRKHTYIVAIFDVLLSIAAMIMGFLVIINPEKYISTGGHPPEQSVANETYSEFEAAAGNETQVKEIQDGVFLSPEEFTT